MGYAEKKMGRAAQRKRRLQIQMYGGRIRMEQIQAGGWQAGIVLDSDLVISTFGEDVNGELYVADYAHGAIYRLRPN